MADSMNQPQPQPAAVPPSTPAEALSTARQVEELADRLSACADSMHERIMQDVHRFPDGVPEAEQGPIDAMLEDEQVLRQRADRLYLDAATCIVHALGQTQNHVIELTSDAAAKIQTITRISDGISLAARLLGLAAAAATAQPIAILPALVALKAQLDAIHLHDPAPAAATASADASASSAAAALPASSA
jgi:hypothetical protein